MRRAPSSRVALRCGALAITASMLIAAGAAGCLGDRPVLGADPADSGEADATTTVDASEAASNADAGTGGDASPGADADATLGADAGLDADGDADADADGNADACASANTLTDGLNCGACGHSCLGGACDAGTCRPVALASGSAVGAITLDGTDLLYADNAGQIWAIPRASDGGVAPVPVRSTGSANVPALITHGAWLYWVEIPSMAATGSVRRCVRAACGDGGAQFGSGLGSTTTIAANDDVVCWSYSDRGIVACADVADGGTRFRIDAGPYGAGGIAVDSDHVYAGSDNHLLRVGLADGGLDTLATSSADAVVNEVQFTGADVVWLETTQTTPATGVARVAADGGARVPIFTGGYRALAVHVATSSTHAYWSDLHLNDGSRTISRCPLSGCTTPEVVVIGDILGANIVADDTALYFADLTTVYRLAK